MTTTQRTWRQPTAPPITLKVARILSNHRQPTPNQLYDLLFSDDPIAWWFWWRAVDWALYRVRHGLPIEHGDHETAEAFQAKLNARFEALADRLDHPRPRPLTKLFPEDGPTLNMATVIEQWRDGPPPAAPEALLEAARLLDHLAAARKEAQPC